MTQITTRRMLEDQGTAIKVRADDKEDDDKNDKEEDRETESPTDSPTASPTLSPSERPTTTAPSWSPTVQASETPTALHVGTVSPTNSFPTANPSVVVTTQNDLIPSAMPSTDVSLGPTIVPTTVTEKPGDAPTFSLQADTEFPTVLDETTKNGENATFTEDSSKSTPDSLEEENTTTSKSSRGALIGLVVGFGTLGCLGSLFAVSKRRQVKPDVHKGGDSDDSVSMTVVPPPIPMPQMKWNDVFQHSLTREEKIGIPPTSWTKSVFQETITEESETGDLEDVVLSSPIQERAVLRAAQQEEAEPDGHGESKDDILDGQVAPDSYTQTVANLLDCGANAQGADTAGETKSEVEADVQSMSSEDLEYMYGTLPLNHLPETPRRSNVSPEGQMQGSRRSSVVQELYTPNIYPTTNLLGPETNAEEEGDDSEPYWV
jgi:hypothetical protein